MLEKTVRDNKVHTTCRMIGISISANCSPHRFSLCVIPQLVDNSTFVTVNI